MKRRKTSRNFEAQSKQIDVHENLKSTILEKKNTRDKSFENLCKLELDGSENLSTDEFSEEQLSEEQLSEDQLSEKNFVQEFSKNKSKDLICNELRSMFHNHKTSKKSSMNFPKNYDSLIKSDNSMSNDLHLDEEHPHFGVDHQLSLILTNMRKMDKKLDRLFDKVYRLEEITMLSGNITYSTEFSRIRDMFPLETIEKYNELNDEMKSDVKLSENLGKFFFLFRKETLQNSINNMLKETIHDSLGQYINITGKNEKINFLKSKIFPIMIDILRNMDIYRNESLDMIISHIGKWFKFAKTRHLRKLK